MPSERIFSPTAGSEVHINWGREIGYVQLVTGTRDHDLIMTWFKSELEQDESGLRPREKMDGWFCDLDRTGINHLIRILRKARDQAFGVDE